MDRTGKMKVGMSAIVRVFDDHICRIFCRKVMMKKLERETSLNKKKEKMKKRYVIFGYIIKRLFKNTQDEKPTV